MQAVIVPAARGWRWFGEGFALYRRNPPALALLVILYWILVGIINVIPLLGPVIASICIPAFSVGIMNACREIGRGGPGLPPRVIGVGMLFSAFRKNPAPLFALGGLYLILTLLVLGLSSLADDGTLLKLMLGGRPGREAIEAPGFTLATLIALTLLVPVLMAYWFAPLLVAWHGFTPGKALFFSYFACLRNWRPFLAYGVVLTVWGIVLPGIALGVLAGFVAEVDFLFAMLLAPLLLILAPTVFASFFITYREVFATAEHVDVRA